MQEMGAASLDGTSQTILSPKVQKDPLKPHSRLLPSNPSLLGYVHGHQSPRLLDILRIFLQQFHEPLPPLLTYNLAREMLQQIPHRDALHGDVFANVGRDGEGRRGWSRHRLTGSVAGVSACGALCGR